MELPLFPGYLFCHFEPGDWPSLVTVPGLVNAVRSGPNLLAADDKEIADLRTAVASGLALDVYPLLKEGRRVTVRQGPLKGVEGWLMKIKETYRVVVSVTILQRALSVELDACCVEPLL
jgi:transcription antitermination factor NusG